MGRKKKGKKKKVRYRNKHHIIPSSIGGSNKDDNIVVIDIELHQHYHAIFKNLHPVKVIEYLVDYFFGGNDEFVIQYLKEKNKL